MLDVSSTPADMADMADLRALAGLAPTLAATVASIAGDIALVIGPDGVVRNVAHGDAPLSQLASLWVGKPFADAVTHDTRSKIDLLLRDVSSTGISRRREVNLPGAEGLDIPVAFAAIRLGADGPVLAVGRDLRAIAAIQQRFVQAQQELERDYWQRRQAESRYRMLFQVATDAVLMVDGTTLLVVEANAAAAALFRRSAADLVGQPATAALAATARPSVTELLVTARTSGRPAEIRARLDLRLGELGSGLVDISATPFRAQVDGVSTMLLLVRARAAALRGADRDGGDPQRFAAFVEQTPDAVVITDSSGRVLMANPAFQLMGLDNLVESQLRGRALAEVLGDPSQRLAGLLAEVRRAGIATQVRLPIGKRGGGLALEVEVSAALLAEGDQECIGFTFRRQVVPTAADLQPLDGLAAAIEHLVGQLGRVPLPELMQDATHLAERHLIRSALLRARGNTSTAAEWLGISAENLAQRLQWHSVDSGRSSNEPPALLN